MPVPARVILTRVYPQHLYDRGGPVRRYLATAILPDRIVAEKGGFRSRAEAAAWVESRAAELAREQSTRWMGVRESKGKHWG